MDRPNAKIEVVLDRAEETLRIARIGASDVEGKDPARRLPGLLNVAVFGRAVTNVLQNLRPLAASFDDWYAPKVAEMRADPLLAFFYKLRTDGLKRADPIPTAQRLHIKHFEFPRDMARFGTPPRGAKAFFMGDRFGGSGWRVVLPDGTEESYYVDLPDDIGVAEMIVVEAPKVHFGKALKDSTAGVLCHLYIAYLTHLVAEARTQFGS